MIATIKWFPVNRRPLTQEEIEDIKYYCRVDPPFDYTYVGYIPEDGEWVLISYSNRVDVGYLYRHPLLDEEYRVFSGAPEENDGLFEDCQDEITAWARFPQPYKT